MAAAIISDETDPASIPVQRDRGMADESSLQGGGLVVLELCSALVTLFNLGLSGVIGWRLLRSGEPGAPERALGCYFLCYSTLSAGLSTTLYMGWSDPSLALPDRLERLMNAAYFSLASLGIFALLVFVRRTFRPREGWARGLVAGTSAALVLGAIGVGWSEGFEVRVLNGPAYWISWAAREIGFVWVALEALRWWGAMRRRLRLGLADPLVANRFLLWSAWGTSVALLGCSDPIARVWYFLRAGSATLWIPEIGHPIVTWVVGFTSAFGIVSAASLFLAFFPLTRYRRWVERRAEALASAAYS